ncbi:hypothetical protein P3S67_028765 [Capsicum chacoense]
MEVVLMGIGIPLLRISLGVLYIAKCLAYGAESNKVDEIMDISLDVLHNSSLNDALQKFFQPEVLDGNNKYKCEK